MVAFVVVGLVMAFVGLLGLIAPIPEAYGPVNAVFLGAGLLVAAVGVQGIMLRREIRKLTPRQ